MKTLLQNSNLQLKTTLNHHTTIMQTCFLRGGDWSCFHVNKKMLTKIFPFLIHAILADTHNDKGIFMEITYTTFINGGRFIILLHLW